MNIPTLSSDDKKIYLAHFDKELQYIKTKEDTKALANIIAGWRISLGIKDVMEDAEHLMNIQFIKENYPHFTIEHLRNAINFSLTGKLPIKNEMYGINFAPLYIGKILSAYSSHIEKRMNQIIKEQKMAKESAMQLPENRGYEQRVKDRRDLILEYYKSVMESETYIADWNEAVWKFLRPMLDPKVINFADAEERGKKAVKRAVEKVLETYINKMNATEQEKEKSKMVRMYGKFYAMKQFFSTIDNFEEWLNKFTDEQILPTSDIKPKD